MSYPRFLGAKVGVGPHKSPLCHRPTQRQTTAPIAQFRVGSLPSGHVAWREATQRQEGSAHILVAQELDPQPTCLIECKQLHPCRHFQRKAGEKSIRGRQVVSHPCKNMSKCEGGTARQRVSQVALPVASDVPELISLRKSSHFFQACYTTACHI